MAKNLPGKAGDTGDVGWILGLGRPLGGGNGNPLKHSCLGNLTDRGAWWATVHEVTKSQNATEHACIHTKEAGVSSGLGTICSKFSQSVV